MVLTDALLPVGTTVTEIDLREYAAKQYDLFGSEGSEVLAVRLEGLQDELAIRLVPCRTNAARIESWLYPPEGPAVYSRAAPVSKPNARLWPRMSRQMLLNEEKTHIAAIKLKILVAELTASVEAFHKTKQQVDVAKSYAAQNGDYVLELERKRKFIKEVGRPLSHSKLLTDSSKKYSALQSTCHLLMTGVPLAGRSDPGDHRQLANAAETRVASP